MPTLADIFSSIDSYKRRLGDTVGNPLSSLQQMVGNANDQAGKLNDLTYRAAQEGLKYGPATQELGRSMAASYSPVGSLEYKGSHVAPNANNYGAFLHDLTQIMPSDVYSASGKRLYGIGDPIIDSQWRVAALKARGKPDAPIDIYRAVPKGVKDINHGDWVTTSNHYAKWHGENVLDGDYDILKKTVPAKTLSTEGYPYEFGYHEESKE